MLNRSTFQLKSRSTSQRSRIASSPREPWPGDAGAKSGAVWTWQLDLDGTFLFCGPGAEQVVGYRADELTGQPADVVLDISELGRSERHLRPAERHSAGWPGLVVQGRHRDGTTLWLEVAGRPLRNVDGTIIGFDGSSRPVVVDAAKVLADQSRRRRIEAVLADELVTTVFQPIVDLSAGTVIGVEALSRFPVDVLQPPDRWFADADEVGLGSELELLAIRVALVAARELPELLYLSVNASPHACLDPRLGDLVAESWLPPERLVIELTEHAPVNSYRDLAAALAPLRRQGVRIAIDDVGAGFSSGHHILQLRPDMVKLDRQVVTGINDDRGRQALGAALVSFAGDIGAQVIAEGIETPDELQTAFELGIDAGQGYLLGRPTAQRSEWANWCDRTPQARPTRPDHLRNHVAADVFDLLPDPTVVVDDHGVIVATNRAWRRIGLENGGRTEGFGVGVSYLDVCDRAARSGDPDARQVVSGLRAVLAGLLDESDWEYPCHLDDGDHWYLSRITSLGSSRGAIAAHLDVTSGRGRRAPS